MTEPNEPTINREAGGGAALSSRKGKVCASQITVSAHALPLALPQWPHAPRFHCDCCRSRHHTGERLEHCEHGPGDARSSQRRPTFEHIGDLFGTASHPISMSVRPPCASSFHLRRSASPPAAPTLHASSLHERLSNPCIIPAATPLARSPLAPSHLTTSRVPVGPRGLKFVLRVDVAWLGGRI
jgi:hypothetical protein